MSTFTRIVHDSIGGIAVTNTYSMRGNFTPDEAFKALGKAHQEQEAQARVEPITITPPMEHFVDAARRYMTACDDRTMGWGHHINCRSAPDFRKRNKGALRHLRGLSKSGRRKVLAIRKRRKARGKK